MVRRNVPFEAGVSIGVIQAGANENSILSDCAICDYSDRLLANYIGQKHRPDFGEGHPAQVLIADALSEYGEKHAPTTRRPDLIGGAISKLIDFFGTRTVAAVTSATCIEYVQWRVRQTDALTS